MIFDKTAAFEYCLSDVVTHERCTLSNGTYELFIGNGKDYMSVLGAVDDKPVDVELQDLFVHTPFVGIRTQAVCLLFVCNPNQCLPQTV